MLCFGSLTFLRCLPSVVCVLVANDLGALINLLKCFWLLIKTVCKENGRLAILARTNFVFMQSCVLVFWMFLVLVAW